VTGGVPKNRFQISEKDSFYSHSIIDSSSNRYGWLSIDNANNDRTRADNDRTRADNDRTRAST